jgi:hypothetical protein
MPTFVAGQLIAQRRAQGLNETHHNRLGQAEAAEPSQSAEPQVWLGWRHRPGVLAPALIAALVTCARLPGDHTTDSPPSTRTGGQGARVCRSSCHGPEHASYE